MSFRTRLTSFFVLIVVLPMLAVGFLWFRLIGDSEQGKADARANGIATAAATLYGNQSLTARADAEAIARDPGLLRQPGLQARLSAFATQSGLARVTVTRGGRVIADVGDRSAIAPGSATVKEAGSPVLTRIQVSTMSAGEYTRDLANPPDVEIVVRQGTKTLSATRPIASAAVLPRQGSFSLAGKSYRTVTQRFPGIGRQPVTVTVLATLAGTSTPLGMSRLAAGLFLVGFLLLALSFSVLASRALHGQLAGFLDAARRLAGGDFSATVPVEGRDEFAALGTEFNNMSGQLERRLDELRQERGRLRDAIRRIGETFASNLDRPALLELALKTAIDAVQGDCGRLSAREQAEEPLSEAARVGTLVGMEAQIVEAERGALAPGGLGESSSEELKVISVALGAVAPGRTHGLITVMRRERAFTDDDRELLRSLASQATLALENVSLHMQVSRQAVTDELTGLANHGRFQELLSAEIEQVRRYHHPVGLIMIDIDNFKSINDTYGHPQGDVVLKLVARVLRDTSREADVAARYGGEEMALILPHTDLEGSYAIAERARASIEALEIPRLDLEGSLRVSASLGVAATVDGEKDDLISEADAALYVAKRQGKNRTVKAQPQTANVLSGE